MNSWCFYHIYQIINEQELKKLTIVVDSTPDWLQFTILIQCNIKYRTYVVKIPSEMLEKYAWKIGWMFYPFHHQQQQKEQSIWAVWKCVSRK